MLVEHSARHFAALAAVVRQALPPCWSPRWQLRNGAAELLLHHLGVLEADAQRMHHVAGEMVAADPQGGGQLQRVAVIHHQFGGLRPDIHHRDPFAPLPGSTAA